MKPVALVVEDDPLVLEIIEINLPVDGWQVMSATNVEAARCLLKDARPDVIVLDIMLPGVSGLELCQEIRQHPDTAIAHLPILMLTALASQKDKLSGFQLGADDYLTKPFDPRELDARLRALLKRSGYDLEGASTTIRRGALWLHLESRQVICNGKTVDLKPQEFDFLCALAQQPDKVFSRTELFREIWKYSQPIPSRTIDTHASRLRQKLKKAHPLGDLMIETVHGIGYKLKILE